MCPWGGCLLRIRSEHSGKFVAFIQGGGDRGDVFERDLSNGSVRDATMMPNGTPFESATRILSISADGQEMLISALGYGLDPNEGPPTIDDNSGHSLYLLSLTGGDAPLINVGQDGRRILGANIAATLSPDGRYVAFEAYDGAYIKDLQTGLLTQVFGVPPKTRWTQPRGPRYRAL